MAISIRSWAVRSAAAIAANLLACTASFAAPGAASSSVPVFYPTRAEAEKAAQQHFKCKGAHQAGNQWMPCAHHGDMHGSGASH